MRCASRTPCWKAARPCGSSPPIPAAGCWNMRRASRSNTGPGNAPTPCSRTTPTSFSPLASGSRRFAGMVVAPCSMSTLGRLACGVTTDLLTRAADVMLKQRRPLLLVPRETPLTSIHLQNMLTLSQCGATILPAMPAFYHRPRTVDDLVSFVAGGRSTAWALKTIYISVGGKNHEKNHFEARRGSAARGARRGGARRVRQTARARHAAHRRHVFVRHHPAGGHEGPEAR